MQRRDELHGGSSWKQKQHKDLQLASVLTSGGLLRKTMKAPVNRNTNKAIIELEQNLHSARANLHELDG